MSHDVMSFSVTGTGARTTDAAAHWPHLDGTGSLVPVPELECDLTSLHLHARPEAVGLVRAVQDKLGLTIGQTAKALGCSRQAVHGWMRGKSIEPRNLANLQALSAMADDWSRSARTAPSSMAWTDSVLSEFAATGLSSARGKAAWDRFSAAQAAIARRRSRIPSSDELDTLLDAKPSTALEQAHRLADNIRSLRRNVRGS